MGAAIGGALPLALGVAISPLPVIAAILMLLSPRARVTGVGFLLGWLTGILAAVSVFTLLSSTLTRDAGGPQPAVGVAQLVLGGLLLLAARNWRSRPRAGQEPVMPRWMGAIDKASMPTAFGLGLLLSGVNPKNLLLGASAGLTIGESAAGSATAAVVAIAVYAMIAASTVMVPVVGYLVAAHRLRSPLDRLREWLVANNALIMAILLLVIGVTLIGKGVGQF